ncbi:MAG: hypothetical protein ACOYOV_11110 [Bacteroidales bacterium]
MENTDCDCLEKTKQKIIEKISNDPNKRKGYKIIEGDYEHKSWYPNVRLYVNFIVKSSFEKVDGSTSKPINEHVSIYFTYCPFCGKKFNNQ